MSEQRVRVMVGEGRSARKGLLRFVLENEGYDVVAEAESTLELAQKLVVYRPDVVVLDDSIDASAVGMMREVLPQAKVILVWPRGVAAVGADARLEPSEVLSFLGPTVARVMGRGPVLAPPKPPATPPVVVVPEAEPETPAPRGAPEPAAGAGEFAAPAEAPTEAGAPTVEEAPVEAAVAERPTEEVPPEIAAELSDVVMAPATLEAPRWSYEREGPRRDERGSRWVSLAALVVAIVAVAVALGALLSGNRTVGILSASGSISSSPSPSQPPGTGTGTGTSQEPGTYHGVLRLHANGTIRMSAEGDLRLRVTGRMRVVATGEVRVRGSGVVKSTTSTGVRIRGNGGVVIVMSDGRMQLRLQGALAGRGRGTVRISGQGRFLIRHHPR